MHRPRPHRAAVIRDEPLGAHGRDRTADVLEAPEPRYRKRAIPLAERRRLAARYGATFGSLTEASCHYCGAPGFIAWTQARYWPVFSLEIDHVIPEFRGGASVAENLVLACRGCNRSKGARV